MPDSRIPLYLITGFLDAGKTTLLCDTLNMDYFNDGQRTVLLRCEDGEEEYDQQFLSQRNCRLIPIEEPEQLNTEFLKEIDRRYQPERVLLEFNGMWPVNVLRTCRLPKTWGLYQAIHVRPRSTPGRPCASTWSPRRTWSCSTAAPRICPCPAGNAPSGR